MGTGFLRPEPQTFCQLRTESLKCIAEVFKNQEFLSVGPCYRTQRAKSARGKTYGERSCSDDEVLDLMEAPRSLYCRSFNRVCYFSSLKGVLQSGQVLLNMAIWYRSSYGTDFDDSEIASPDIMVPCMHIYINTSR